MFPVSLIDKLIELVSVRPWLYDTGHRLYHDLTAKTNAWKSVQDELGLPPEIGKHMMRLWEAQPRRTLMPTHEMTVDS